MTFVTDCIPCYRNSFFFYFFFIFLLSFAPLDLDHPTRKKKKETKFRQLARGLKIFVEDREKQMKIELAPEKRSMYIIYTHTRGRRFEIRSLL